MIVEDSAPPGALAVTRLTVSGRTAATAATELVRTRDAEAFSHQGAEAPRRELGV
ncbi:hypothetical protein [Amycolatopsis mediterranei]|uniref:Uncharacterized protein n=1 Tax=Amycolatopsis mediterranei (strain S699) TaxID=713604 RepID=A0A9R0NQS1_AMYMS|nr:hypothetical protein [Amycolatopsis mediterranei]AEK38903.1 hypothetical protein RAM_02055 [Amycolatopsis mediterranei S699]UZF67402.1 hypothetical protein ISP_000408 [Amycolatopsis mediterranei]